MIIPLPGGLSYNTDNTPDVFYLNDGQITLHVPLALSRLIERWKNKPNLAALLSTYMNEVQLLENAIQDVKNQRLPDNAGTAQLDAIGRIVGQPRLGLSNVQFRALIKARIRSNQSFGTAEDVIQVLQLVDPAAFIFVDAFPAAFIVHYTTPPDDAVASQIPKIIAQTRAAGVGSNVTYPVGTSGALYGWSGDATLHPHGYGWSGDSTVGSHYGHAA